jgi:predicted RNA-binding protein with EMAP domain
VYSGQVEKEAAGVKHMAGEVVSVNANTKSLTVKHTGKKKARDLTSLVAAPAVDLVAERAAGHVAAEVVVEDGGDLPWGARP